MYGILADMSDLYTSLLKLNHIENAFEAWTDYRHALTSFILSHVEGSRSCLIVGAGACNDIDLVRLSAKIQSVALLDTDEPAMEQGIKRYGLDNIAVRVSDILGIPESAYRALDNLMLSGIRNELPGAVLTNIYLKEMDAMLQNAKPDPLPDADTIICCGVHSQLLAMFARMAAVYARYANIDTQRIYKCISRYNAKLQPVFNTCLLQSAGKALILGLEAERIDMPGGIEGAAQALADIDSRRLKTTRTKLLWPFDATQNKTYAMNIVAVDTGAAPC